MGGGREVTMTTTKLVELVNIAIDAWSYSKNSATC